MALQLRRGTNAQRLGLTPVEGEMIYVTDNVLVSISVTSIDIGTDVLTTSVEHGLILNQQVKFIGTTLNGLTKDQVYYVKTTPTTTTFTLSTTLGGGTLNISGTYTVPLVFAKTPCLANGAPVGYDVSPLWTGDGFTVGGNPSGAILLDELRDVIITAPPVEGQFLVYDGTNWVNDNETSVDTRAKTLSLTRRSDSAGENFENEVTLRLQDRLTDNRSYATDEGGPAISYERSSGVELTKTYVSGGAIGAFTVTLNNVTGIVVGDRIVGTGLTNSNAGVLVTVIAGNQLTLNTAFTVQASGTYTIGAAIAFGHVAMEWFGSTNLHRFRVLTSTDNFLESPANTYPGTTTLIESTKNATKINEGVVYVDAVNDRLGVNTTTPTNALEINGGILQYTAVSADRPLFRYDNSDAGPNTAIRMRKNYGAGTYTTGDGTSLAFQIDSDAQDLKQLGLIDALWDATAPAIRFRTNTTSSLTTGYVDVATFTSALATLPAGLNVDSGTLFVDATNNRVGILNSSPTVALDVTGAAKISSNLTVDSGTLFVDATNNRVGVNNNSPSYALDVTGEINLSGENLYMNQDNTNADVTVHFNTGRRLKWSHSNQRFELNGGLNVDSGVLFVDDVNNRVGISNSTPNFELDVAGSAYISSGLTNIGNTNLSNNTLTINSGNNRVGINTTSPAATNGLDIRGGLIATTTVAAERPVFTYTNSSTGVNNALFLKKDYTTGTYTTGDGVGIALQLDSDTQNTNSFAIVNASWNATAPQITLGTNINDNTAGPFISVATFTSEVATTNAKLNVGTTLQTPSSDTVTTGNISVVTAITKFTTTNSAQTSTLPTTGASDGQFKTLVRTGTGSASMVVTVTNAGWKGGASGTITFGNQGDSCFLQYVSGYGWVAIGVGWKQPVFA